jgi:hypothetical protein
MGERVGVLSRWPSAGGDRLLLTLPDGSCQLVEPELTDDDLAARYRLDRVVRLQGLDICAATHVDGPLAGMAGYATNRIGYRVEFALPPRPGGARGMYEVVKLADGEQPAELRFVGYIVE